MNSKSITISCINKIKKFKTIKLGIEFLQKKVYAYKRYKEHSPISMSIMLNKI